MLPECHSKSILQTVPLGATSKCFGGATTLSLQRQLLFEGNEISSNQGDLSAEDEIARAKARVHTPARKKKRRPSSKSLLQVGLGEGRATRKVEIIWWPNVYTVTEHGQMIIRMYIYRNVIFKHYIFKNLFSPKQLEKIKFLTLNFTGKPNGMSISMGLVTLPRLMWKNITRLFLAFGSGSEMYHIIILCYGYFFIALMHVHVRPAQCLLSKEPRHNNYF